jgi:hypothetical protein
VFAIFGLVFGVASRKFGTSSTELFLISQIFLQTFGSYGADFQNNKFILFPLLQYKWLFLLAKEQVQQMVVHQEFSADILIKRPSLVIPALLTKTSIL